MSPRELQSIAVRLDAVELRPADKLLRAVFADLRRVMRALRVAQEERDVAVKVSTATAKLNYQLARSVTELSTSLEWHQRERKGAA